MSSAAFDSANFAELVKREYPAPVARPFAFLAAATSDDGEILAHAQHTTDALLRYLALVALRGAIAVDLERGGELARGWNRNAPKGEWLRRLRDALAVWEDAAAIALLGPDDVRATQLSASALGQELERLVELRNDVVYRSASPRALREQVARTLEHAWGLRGHRLLLPRKIVAQAPGVRRYEATVFRGHAEPYPTIEFETELELELGQPILGCRGSHALLPLAPLVLECTSRGKRDLHFVQRIDERDVEARALLDGAALEPREARTARDELERLLAGFASTPRWMHAKRWRSDDDPPTGTRRFARGERIAERYEIEEFLACGASADVYAARDASAPDRPAVALKVLPFQLARSQTSLARLSAEVRAARAARHPNVVGVLDNGVHADDAFVVLELADGWPVAGTRARDLETYLRLRTERGDGPLAGDEVRALADDLARGLGAVHAARILHRDIKPANVLLFGGDPQSPRRAKLGDFGISRSADANSATHEGFRAGTSRYMAPERLDPARALPVGEASDWYSLGCVLYEALMGSPPFVADSEREVELAHLSRKPESLEALRPDAPPALRTLVHRLLAKKPENRPRGANEVLALLADPAPRAFDDVVQPEQIARDPARSRRERVLAWSSSVVLALVVIGVWWRSGRPVSAAEHAQRMVDVLCERDSDENVRALFLSLHQSVNAGREEFLRDPDGSRRWTPIVQALVDELSARSEFGCVLGGLARCVESGAFAELRSSEGLGRILCQVSYRRQLPDEFYALARAYERVELPRAMKEYVAPVISRGLLREISAFEEALAQGRLETLDTARLAQIRDVCARVLDDDPPRLCYDFEFYRSMVLGFEALARRDPNAAATAITRLEDFTSDLHAASVDAAIAKVLEPEDREPQRGGYRKCCARARNLLSILRR